MGASTVHEPCRSCTVVAASSCHFFCGIVRLRGENSRLEIVRVSPFTSWFCTVKAWIVRAKNVSVWVKIRRVKNMKTRMVYHRGSRSIGGVPICPISRGGSCKVMDDSSQSWTPDYTMLKEGESSIFYLEEDGEIHIENENGGAYFIGASCGGGDSVNGEGDEEEYQNEPSFEGADFGDRGTRIRIDSGDYIKRVNIYIFRVLGILF
ncbi:maltose ABC transporter permease MalF [Sesbania bispinosa]|nr:maltose ABC transporter permease MalF [Sesbania bispinosa]